MTETQENRGVHARMRSRLIHGSSKTRRWEYDHHIIPPISSSSAYRLDSLERGSMGFLQFARDPEDLKRHFPIYIYDRLDEPTRGMLEENLAYAENGEVAVTFASGMAAISAALGITATTGQQIITHNVLYGCTYSLLRNWYPRYNIDVKMVDLGRADVLRDVLSDNTRVVYFETPVNPTMKVIDIEAIREIVDNANAKRTGKNRIFIVVDNTFSTPFCQRPLQLGADMVVDSLTKNVGGFGTELGGAVITSREHYHSLMLYRKDFGGVLSSKSAWSILVYGLPTLAARMVNQQKTAMKVATFLKEHPRIETVVYPGLDSFPQRELARRQMRSYDGKFAPGHMMYFTINQKRGERDVAQRFINHIAKNAYSITMGVSLGQVKTLIESPFHMTHSAMTSEEKIAYGIHPNGIRLSLGLEDWHDIIQDLERALNAL